MKHGSYPPNSLTAEYMVATATFLYLANISSETAIYSSLLLNLGKVTHGDSGGQHSLSLYSYFKEYNDVLIKKSHK